MLVAATNNRKKLKEINEILAPLGVPVRSAGEFGIDSPVEDGDTFHANALIKAVHTFRATGAVTLADDSGLEVDALGGEPGVHSAYFAGPHGDDDDNNRRLVRAMAGQVVRTARYRTVIVLLIPDALRDRVPEAMAVPVHYGIDAVMVQTAGATEGEIVDDARGHHGFGYDPYFFYPPAGLTFAEMTPEAKHAVSHRGAALAALRPILERLFA